MTRQAFDPNCPKCTWTELCPKCYEQSMDPNNYLTEDILYDLLLLIETFEPEDETIQSYLAILIKRDIVVELEESILQALITKMIGDEPWTFTTDDILWIERNGADYKAIMAMPDYRREHFTIRNGEPFLI